jgi:hypothetical protein
MFIYRFRARVPHHLVYHRSVARKAGLLFFQTSLFTEVDRKQQLVVLPKQNLVQKTVLQCD